MIGSAIQEGEYIKVLDINGSQQNSFYVQGVLFGYSSEIICTQKGDYIYVFDSNGHELREFYVGNGKGQAVIDSNINVKEGSYLSVYDKGGSKLHQNYVG